MSNQIEGPPILSIVIPTYNRCGFLKECLQSLVKELKGLHSLDDVEVIISDNASTDNTRKMLERDFPEIKYFCNRENMGVEYNVNKCFEYAAGEYIYILSDDDILLSGSLKEIMRAIGHNPNFIYLNAVNFYKELADFSTSKRPRLNILQDVITDDKMEFFKLVNIQITFLSTSIFRGSIAKSVDRSLYEGEFIASGQTVLSCLKEPGKYVAIGRPCVAARSGTTGGYNLYTVWVKGYKRLIMQVGCEAGIARPILKSVYKKTMLTQILKFILLFRTTEKGLGLENRHYIFNGIKEFPSLWIPFVLATYSPTKVLMILRKIHVRYKKYVNKEDIISCKKG